MGHFHQETRYVQKQNKTIKKKVTENPEKFTY